jgi:hypothetical protein
MKFWILLAALVVPTLELAIANNPCEQRLLSFETFGDIQLSGITRNDNNWFLGAPFGEQVVIRSDEFERSLVDHSRTNEGTIEVMTFRASRDNEMIFFGRISRGHHSHLAEEVFELELKAFLDEFHETYQDGALSYVEIAHTHPDSDFIQAGLFSVSPLNDLDLQTARETSLRLGVPVVIKAIVPNGYTYAAAFFNGINQTFSAFRP